MSFVTIFHISISHNLKLLAHFSDHKYNCISNSLLDKFLQHWWCFLVSKTPLYIAPNLLTIVGLLVNILTSVILIWHSPDAKTEAPRWCYLACAIGLFIYQSLDAIGKCWQIVWLQTNDSY